eukprot:jgi/Botrbrau1/10675/Bobra.139_2s0005.1
MSFIFIPLCFEFGSDNACRCKVVGPTIGFIGAVLSAVVCYPAGALTYCCDRKLSNRLFGAPVEISRDITNTFPI